MLSPAACCCCCHNRVLMAFFSARSTTSVPICPWVMDNLCCVSCSAPLQPEDIHDMCPPCLGVYHLREALSHHACSNCSVLPRAVQLARLSSVEQPADWAVSVQQDPLLPGQVAALMKQSAADMPLVSGRRAKRRRPLGLSTTVDQLSTELAQMKALLQPLRADGGRAETSPHEQGGSPNCKDDAISVVASGTLFREDFSELDSRISGSGSGASQGDAGEPVSAALRTALGCLQLDVPPAQALAAMHEAPKFGLGCMPPVESAIASLTVPPDEALRPNARCPRPQCRVTDDLHCRAYDSGARMGRIGNSLSSSSELVLFDQSTQGLLDASLLAFTLMTCELGCTLSTLIHAQRPVCLAQSSLTEPCMRTLRALPVVPGELFGSAVLEALERRAQASQTRQQLASLHRPACWPVAAGAAGDSLWGSFPPPVPFLGSTSMVPRPRPARAQGDHGGAQALHPV
ncbi:hypothetical protein GOODEAATRI_009522 [Goodea atripinnis]|uniref:Uncharacterized protein n=1 Tax=Goodea atripinnis TaxID=208336 RepID=A0ABV0P4G9_9TELE